MGFQSLKQWKALNEGGAAISDSRRLNWQEAQNTLQWVKDEVIPELGLDPEDVEPIGSYGKKREGQDYGDLDLIIPAKKIMDAQGIGPDEILSFIDNKLKDLGYDTKPSMGFNQVSFGAPIPGTEDVAQVDLMISPDMDWSRFIYYSPNFRENESQYKGQYRNALLMAIITETSKNILKQSDLGVEELESNVVRYPGGIWKARKSFAGKKGLVKTGKLLKEFDKFITTNPQEVVELAVGPGYSIQDISTFEKLWKIINDPDYIHAGNLTSILTKFAGNLKAQAAPYPKEAVEEYPDIFMDGIVKESLDSKNVIEDLADQEHDSWARWMKYLFKVSEKKEDGTVIIPKNKVDRWERQAKTDYKDLSNKEKESDRKEVKKFIKIAKENEK